MPVMNRNQSMYAPYRGHAGPMMRHQPSTGGTMDDIKAFLDKETISGVPNKFLIGGALVLGLAYYGHTQRWF